MNNNGNVHQLPSPEGTPQNGRSGGNSNGNLTKHRLAELERRMRTLENKVDKLIETCTRIETKLDEKAGKSYVLQWFGISSVVLIVTLVGHILLRS